MNPNNDISKSHNNLHVIPHSCESGGLTNSDITTGNSDHVRRIPVRGATCVKFLQVPSQDCHRPLTPISPGELDKQILI